MSIILTILLFILVLAILVLVHELGHFLTARFFKIDVEEFGFGFPPRIMGWKKGNTTYTINWIPLGGFVRIKGEDQPADKSPGNFGHKPARIRAAVIGAGVFMNLLLASLLFAICFMIGLPQIAEDLPPNARARDFNVQVIEVLKDMPAEKADVRAGDIILEIDGRDFDTVSDIQDYVDVDEGSLHVKFRRGKETIEKDITPAVSEETGKRIMGVALVETALVSYPPHVALAKGVGATWFYVKEIIMSVYGWFKDLVVSQKSDVEFAGPVGIAVLTGRVARLGFVYLLQFAALLSVNLAVINILPIPALDGGRLLFIIIEKFRGHAVRPKVEAAFHKVAFFGLMLVALLVTIKDLDKYKEQILKALYSLFGVT